jgi:GT2 family glycosyltransferase
MPQASKIKQAYSQMKFWLYLQTKDKWLKYKRQHRRPDNLIEFKADIVNWLRKIKAYRSYLQISTYTTGGYFDEVNYPQKHCLNYVVEGHPMPSGSKTAIRNDHHFPFEYFELGKERLLATAQKYDVIFVDSYHTFEQTYKDIELACQLVTDNGIIIIHDCSPVNESQTGELLVEGTWAGQTYEAFVRFRYQHPEHNCFVIDIDYGCGIIHQNQHSHTKATIPEGMLIDDIIDFKFFDNHRHSVLNLRNVDDFKLDYCSGDFLSKTLICIVLYNQTPEESSSYQSLLNTATEGLNIKVLLFDNSSQAQDFTQKNSSFSIDYYHSSSNVGVAGAYNFAAQRAKETELEWLLFFDQDSVIPDNFFEKLIIAKQENQDQELFVPLVEDSGAVVSPSYSTIGKLSEKKYFAGLKPSASCSIINSGMMLSLRIFEELGGYHAALPMYYSDSYFFSRYQKKYSTFVLQEAVLKHQMKLSSRDKSEVEEVYNALYPHTKAYAKLINKQSPSLFYIKLGLLYVFRFKSLSFLKIGLRNLLW